MVNSKNMQVDRTKRGIVSTCSLTFFVAMVLLSVAFGLLLGIGAMFGLAAPALSSLVLGGLTAPVFRQVVSRQWGLFLSMFAGGVFGIVNLYLGTFLLSLPLALASYPYFDFTNSSHWGELFTAQLVLAGIPAAALAIFPTTALAGAFIWKRLQNVTQPT